MHFYNFNVKDFNASTRHLTHLERALFRDLIDMYYVEEKAITSNMATLERKLLVHTEEERQALKNVLADFFTLKALKGDGEKRYHIKRIDREIKNYRHRQATSSSEHQVTSSETSNEHQENIKPKDVHYKKVSMMVNALKNKGIKANMRMKMADLQALFDEHCNQTSSEHQVTSSEHQETSSECQVPFHESITNNHKPITKNQNNNKRANELFENFYARYPNKKSKANAEKAFLKLIKESKEPDVLYSEIMTGLERQLPTLISSHTSGFCKHPATWLNGKCWLDEIQDVQPVSQPVAEQPIITNPNRKPQGFLA